MWFSKGCSVFVLVWLVLVMVVLEMGTCDGAKNDHSSKKPTAATPSGFKTVAVKGHGHKKGHHKHHHNNHHNNHPAASTPTTNGHGGKKGQKDSSVPACSTPSEHATPTMKMPGVDKRPKHKSHPQPNAATPSPSSQSQSKSHPPSVTVQTVANPADQPTDQPANQPTARPPDVSNSVASPPVSQNENLGPSFEKSVTSLPGRSVQTVAGPVIAITLVGILGMVILISGLKYAYDTRKISQEKKYSDFVEFNGDPNEFKF